jgi:hypothetical protein
VTLGLALSATLVGCSPAACAAPPLRPLLSDASAGCELQLAGLHAGCAKARRGRRGGGSGIDAAVAREALLAAVF